MKRRYTFGCPVCSKRFVYDEPGEPCCTGPSEMRDDHPLEVMRLISVERVAVAPTFAEARATGELLLPHMDDAVEREARVILRA